MAHALFPFSFADSITNSLPCRMVNEACFAMGTLAQKIATFVASLFTAIADLIQSCLPRAPVSTPTSVSTPDPTAASLASLGVRVHDYNFLGDRLKGYVQDNPSDYLKCHMHNETTAQYILAHLIVRDLVMLPHRGRGGLPDMISKSLIAQILTLRTTFAEFDEQTKRDILEHFDKIHLSLDYITPLPLNYATGENTVFSEDVLDAVAPDTPANVFYVGVINLANSFIHSNPAFVVTVNAVRTDYARRHNMI